MSQQRRLEQERASFAWSRVADVRENGKNNKSKSYAGEYGSLARSASADILANGLGPTLAFWYAKGYENRHVKDGGNAHAHLLQDMGDWVMGQLNKDPNIAENLKKNQTLLEWVIHQASSDQYRRAMSEALALVTWVKRFAEAELGTSAS